nr:tRNA lysidine(34) synthetase TilS [Halovulum dunhuangense]
MGVAVSGGGDSTALLVLLSEWCNRNARTLAAVTVDHGLRPESAFEAASVARLCHALGVEHAILRWEGWDRRGNLQDAARNARRGLVAAWAGQRGIAAVALGHTREDQAETVLLRLARGSGVDGLSAMAPVAQGHGLTWLRPLLGTTRGALRDFLTARGIAWHDDPSNEDPRFDRVRIRRAMPHLAELGLTTDRLVATAQAMARARAALEAAADALAGAAAQALPVGAVRIAAQVYADALPELRLRLLSRALGWVASSDYRPRLDALGALDAALTAGPMRARTLQGCVISRRGNEILVCREWARCAEPVPAGEIWDRRWATRADRAGLSVSALGASGLAACPDWRETGWPRAALLASPAFRRGDALIAAPFAKPAEDCHAWLLRGPDGFRASARER